MALNVRIDFNDVYELEEVSINLSTTKFTTELSDGNKILLGVLISNTAHPLLPDVYNLSFGPIDKNDNIDDSARLTHANHSKVFSTIILTALAFLNENPNKYLGIDGSNNARAYLYYRMIQNNFDFLSQFFEIYGVNYYVRILRKTKDSDNNYPIDPTDFEAIPKVIKKDENIPCDKLYNYYIFKNNNQQL